VISTFTVFFDANVFFGARLRSVIVTLAQTGLFRARWSDDVHREWMRAVVEKRPDLTLEKLEPTRRAMDRAVPDCLVAGYEPLIPSLTLPDPDDRHVLAAAIAARASVIVTFNVTDFLPPHSRCTACTPSTRTISCSTSRASIPCP
jgi:predicted nucleic acid-binding protein